jgi:hypothetical protein
MCKAFSCIVKQNGEVLWKFAVDSHDEILKLYNIEDKENNINDLKFARVEIIPDNKNYLFPDKWTLKIDEQIKPTWFSDSYETFCLEEHAKWLSELDKILIRKPIVNPFDIEPPKKITEKHIKLVKKWASVLASVVASVGVSVGDSVRASVGDSVWASVWVSVGDSVRAFVGASVGASVWAYSGSFFKLNRNQWKYTKKIKTKKYPFQSAVDLWNLGLVPSFDGTTWRLHGEKDAKILYETKI